MYSGNRMRLRARNGISLVDSDVWKLIDRKTKLIESQREFFVSVSNSYVIIWNNWWFANCMDESNTGVYFFCLDHVFILIFIECLASQPSLFTILFFLFLLFSLQTWNKKMFSINTRFKETSRLFYHGWELFNFPLVKYCFHRRFYNTDIANMVKLHSFDSLSQLERISLVER